VSNVNFALWRGVRGWAEIIPVCPDVDSMWWLCN